MSKIQIIPAVLPRDFSDLEDHLSQISGLVKEVQIDVCDGQLTPQASWPYRKADQSFEKIVSQAEGLPFWKEFDYEIDLMANRPDELVGDWISAGARRIVIHYEAEKNKPGSVLRVIEKIEGVVQVGLALDIGTPISVVEALRSKIQYIQCMGIDRIGFQGQDFDREVITKISAMKTTYPDLPVSVDGGVSLENASALISAGAERLVIGSAIFQSENVYESIQKFKRLGKANIAMQVNCE